MHVEQIELKNVMRHRDSFIKFPERGITLVTGENGSGKSCLIIESVSAGFWGKTLRKTPVWRDDSSGLIIIAADVASIKRTKSPSGSPKLEWSSTKYPTTTKTQDSLENVVGDWDRWRRTSILSSQDVSHFTLATDSERKKLIENLLGCDRFDPAYKKCREDLREAESRFSRLDTECAVLRERVTGLQNRLEDLKNQKDEEPEEEISEDELANVVEAFIKISKQAKACSQEIREIVNSTLEQKSKLRDALVEVSVAKKEKERLDKDKCPYCGRPITEDMKKELKKKVDETKQTVADLQKQIEEEEERNREELEELEEENEALRAKLNDKSQLKGEIEQKLRNQRDRKEAKERRAKLVKQLKQDVINIDKESIEKEDEWDELTAEIAELKATVKVLGPEGFRAHIIGKALSGIEAVGNRWLGLIAKPDLRMKLKPYSEKKTGGVKDKISLEITGAGGGHGYNGASAGERRRIDVALLFALAEIATAANDLEQGDIFVDEVADGLDAKGRSAVAEALKEFAATQSVIVITHDEMFSRLLEPKQHIHLTLDKEERTVVNYLKEML